MPAEKRECACGRDRWRTPFIQEKPALFRLSERNPNRWGWSCASYLEIVEIVLRPNGVTLMNTGLE